MLWKNVPSDHRPACGISTFLLLGLSFGILDPTSSSAQTELPSAGQQAPADETTWGLHLLRRATYGPRVGDLDRVLSMGIEGWLRWQMDPEEIEDEELEARLAAIDAVAMAPADLMAAYPPPRVVRREMEEAGVGEPDSLSPGDRRRLMRELGLRPPGWIAAELAQARLLRAVISERQLEAVMTDFWFDHFNVFWAKGPLKWLVADYETTAIRPHVFGRFEDMLRATAGHPAMLVYLDNWRSAAPDSPMATKAAGGRRPNLPTGLNENYARELLELHTLGVDGGYSQADVEAVARAFTGWTLDRGRREGMRRGRARNRERDSGEPGAAPGEVVFRFRPEMHDTGGKTVLGHSLPAGRGMEDGLDVLHLLATHPSTARLVATRLVQAFVADDPPPAIVGRVAGVFVRTEGDLAEVTRALFTDPEFAAPDHVLTKVKSPFDLVASALRAMDAEIGPSRELLETLRELEEAPYLASAPTGYPEASAPWASGGAMLQRMNLALDLAAGEIEGVDLDLASLYPANGAEPGGAADPLAAAVERLLPGVDHTRLQEVVVADLEAEPRGAREAAARAVGLILGSPEFQLQ